MSNKLRIDFRVPIIGYVRGLMNRRSFLLSASGVVAHPLLNSLLPASSSLLHAQQTSAKSASSKSPLTAANHSLTIKPCTIEISPGVNIKTIAYNGQVPGPLLRLRQGVPVTIDVTNATESAEIVHWHGPYNRLAERRRHGRRLADDSCGRTSALQPHAKSSGLAVVPHAYHRRREPRRGDVHRPIRFPTSRRRERSQPLRSGGLPGHPSVCG